MQHLYVCLFSNGHIKVGRSINPMERIASHEDRVSCLGVELVDHQIFECKANVIRAEAELIQQCTEMASKTNNNEWFVGLDFEIVCGAADECAKKVFADPAKNPNALFEFLSIHGNQAMVAGAIGVTPGLVNQWKTGFRQVPVHYCASIERLSGGLVTRQFLRPNDFHLIWPEISTTQKDSI